MRRGDTAFQRCVGLLLAILLPAVGTSISLLDMMPEDGRSGIECQHHPGTHGPRHNHLICIQQAANQWAPAAASAPPVLAGKILLPLLPQANQPLRASPLHLPHSRAPPRA
jgi:hypothetical protein